MVGYFAGGDPELVQEFFKNGGALTKEQFAKNCAFAGVWPGDEAESALLAGVGVDLAPDSDVESDMHVEGDDIF